MLCRRRMWRKCCLFLWTLKKKLSPCLLFSIQRIFFLWSVVMRCMFYTHFGGKVPSAWSHWSKTYATIYYHQHHLSSLWHHSCLLWQAYVDWVTERWKRYSVEAEGNQEECQIFRDHQNMMQMWKIRTRNFVALRFFSKKSNVILVKYIHYATFHGT